MRLIHPLAVISICGLIPTLTACGSAPMSASKPAYAPGGAPDSASYAEEAAEQPAPMAYPSQPMAGAAAPGQPQAMPPAPPPAMSPDAQPKRALAATEVADRGKSKPPKVAVGPVEPQGTEQYTDYGVNPAVDPAKDPLSTFAIDVDTASYTIARSKLTSSQLPPFQAVRTEEFLNYFNYGYAGPQGKPFAVHLHAAPSPYQTGHHILRVGVQAKQLSRAERTNVHLVYLVDTSGSMRRPNKLGLAKKSLKLLTKELKPGDTVAICTYAGSTRVVLPPTGANQRQTILSAIDQLSAGGGTAMSSGMEMAYELAQRTQVKGHISRVVVLSDGDANIGRSNHQAILQRIGHFKDQGITLSTVGFGRGNYKDTMMEQLANKGDGNYAYIDTEAEARRAFGEQLNGMLEVVARDVKIQVEFDPRVVRTYRLIGYENRDVADRDFRNDQVDAGEIGAGHNVTALYDVVLKAQPSGTRTPVIVRLRHKQPLGSNKATEMAVQLKPHQVSASFAAAPKSLRFATAVAGFAEVLRKSPHASTWSLDTVERIAREASWGQAEQRELVELVGRARRLLPARSTAVGAVMAK
ncbi:MAG: von Willebrand factor type A domain-containing protein [Deltaproteobacteria bacterium]|nr:von Willebrand factor type A domain-containing protein [Deltaproteobacteria bacterium]